MRHTFESFCAEHCDELSKWRLVDDPKNQTMIMTNGETSTHAIKYGGDDHTNLWAMLSLITTVIGHIETHHV